MIKISASILILLLISSLQSFPQKKAVVWRYEGPRVGIDLSRFLVPYLQQGKRNGWEVQADIPYKGNFFPTVELGMQWFDDQRDGFHYKNNGTYARLGIDMNIVKFESLKDHDLLFVGARYGYSVFNHETDGISYTNYWGSVSSSVPSRSLNAHWAELVLGMKGELFSNFFLGWSLRAKFPIVVSEDPNIKPYIIPGIGKVNSGTPFDFSVGFYYRFPIFKTRTLPKPIKMGGATHPGENDGSDPNNPGSQGGSRPGMGGLRSLRGGGQ
jgi:hypothetical protein